MATGITRAMIEQRCDPSPKRRPQIRMPQRPNLRGQPHYSADQDREEPGDRFPAGGGYRVIRRPRMLDREE
jgi:hypothetical protein